MNTFEPGRVYSCVVNGERKDLLRRSELWADDKEFYLDDQVTDVRGPLVVLDHHDFPNVLRDLREGDRDAAADWIADQIEEQTRPPLQVGWHEVAESLPPRYWDGHVWRYGPRTDATHEESFTSTHYIGPGSQS